QLPIAKPMHWGNHRHPFIRPVHWIVTMYGNKVIPCEFFSLQSSNKTYGHRFHQPAAITIEEPEKFSNYLESGFVVASYEKRRDIIRNQIISVANAKGTPIIDEDLLNEVTGLAEWPVALIGNFDERFLKVPKEALISAMK